MKSTENIQCNLMSETDEGSNKHKVKYLNKLYKFK